MTFKKTIPIYPYQCFTKRKKIENRYIAPLFSSTHFKKNIRPYTGQRVSILADANTDNGPIKGLFSKLKKDSIPLRNEETGEPGVFSPQINWDVEEPTFFVWDNETGIMLASFNENGLKILGERIKNYLGEIVNTEIVLKPFFQENFLKKLQQSKKILNLYVNVTQPTEGFLEDAGFKDADVFKYSPSEGYSFSLSLSGKPAFGKKAVARIVEAIRGHGEDIGTAKITLEDEVKYNILKDTYLHYSVEIEKNDGIIDSRELGIRINELFFRHKEDLIRRIPDIDLWDRGKQQSLI